MTKKLLENPPKHVAMIPDGNRRWAKERGLKPWEGHIEGMRRNLEDIIDAAIDAGVSNLTLWGGSYDNLTKRSKVEIKVLNGVYRSLAEDFLAKQGSRDTKISVRFLGEWQGVLESESVKILQRVERETASNKDFYFTGLIAYNGDKEMLDAINKLTGAGGGEVTDESIYKHLWTADLPPVDLIIRTGVDGDPHNSAGFMMWHTRYSQLYFTPTFWPDFDKKEFLAALQSFSKRERRLGK